MLQTNLAQIIKYSGLDSDQELADLPENTDLHHLSVKQIDFLSVKTLVLNIETKELLLPQWIILLESKLEKAFGIPEVIIRQEAVSPPDEEEKITYLAQVSIWLKRHAEFAETFESSIFAKSQVEIRKDSIFCFLNDHQFALVNKENNWLIEFWYHFGSFPCEIVLKSRKNLTRSDIIERTEQLIADAESRSSELYQQKVEEIQNTAIKQKEHNAVRRKYRKSRQSDDVLWGRTGPAIPLIKIREINNETERAYFEGEVFSFESKITRNNRLLIKFAITDQTASISCTLFTDPEEEKELTKIIDGQYIRVTAKVFYDDRFAKEFVANVTCIEKAERPLPRMDQNTEKRVELHIHSKLSAKDGTINPADIVKTASRFGHPAVAITDHGVVQGFPDVCNTADQLAKAGHPIKIIYGVEGYLLDDGMGCFAYEVEDIAFDRDFIIFDIISDGDDPGQNRIKEISAVKVRYQKDLSALHSQENNQETAKSKKLSALLKLEDFQIVDTFTKTLNQSSDHPEDPETALDILSEFKEFSDGSLFIAENALVKLNFLRYAGFRVTDNAPRIKFNPPLIDLAEMIRLVDQKQNKTISEPDKGNIGCSADLNADESSKLSSLIDLAAKYLQYLQIAEVDNFIELNYYSDFKTFRELKNERKKSNHILLLVQDSLGLYNLYRLCSDAHIKYFYYSPRIPRSVLSYYGAGIIKGMACVDGEIFSAIVSIYKQAQGDFSKAKQILRNHPVRELAKRYTFLEIQPLTNNSFLLREENNFINSKDDLQNLNRLVLELGKLSHKMVCATGDVHYLNPEDDIYRKILMTNMNFEDMEEMADLYFRTTDEMLNEFSYLDENTAHDVVIKNPNLIADMVEADLRPFPQGSFPPIIKSADQDIRELTMRRAFEIYGYENKLPEIVEKRLQKELTSIIDNGFAIMYYIAHSVVKKSNEDGYIVGSRGSVGSSLVATLCGITEVNPLQPHYVCPDCHYAEFDDSGNYGSGFDLPPKKCPKCGADFIREGQDIPFETFLGFYGDKQPDIDLNFSGFYQSRAHQFIEEMFGVDKTFRAGTISSYAEKNSAGMVLNYFESNQKNVSNTEVSRLAKGLQGVKVTTGQHPGGMVVIPRERDIYDFTPIQYPANKADSHVITTHFDFNSLHDTILKLDILGHDDPSMLKMLGDITGIDVTTIPIPDDKVMSLFHSTSALGIPDEESTLKAATIGIPELGTFLVRNMIAETKPKNFYDLVQISGLSHGTDVWSGNAQTLIKDGICTINEVIGCRDSIMTYLIYHGLPNKDSFDIMEKVRKGKGLSQEHEALMREHQIPDWYIESCKKIKYMFPKAHAVAYLISALRIAWFKVYYPEAYYCAYFTIRAPEFSSDELCLPPEIIKQNRAEQRRDWNNLTAQQQKKHFYLELVEEMQARGIDFLPIDLEKSKAVEFYSPQKNEIRPPLNAIPNISDTLAKQIVKAREEGGLFKTQEELARRAELGQVAMESLKTAGVLKGLPESAQIDLFSLLG